MSARVSRGPVGDPEERSIPGGGGKTLPPTSGEAEERSGPGKGAWLRREFGEGATPFGG